MASVFICSKNHKTDSCFQLGMCCKVHLPLFVAADCRAVSEYFLIHWHLKVFPTLFLCSMMGGPLSSPGADQACFGWAWWLVMVMLRQRSCWCQYQWQQWEVVTTPSSGRGQEGQAGGCKMLWFWCLRRAEVVWNGGLTGTIWVWMCPSPSPLKSFSYSSTELLMLRQLE